MRERGVRHAGAALQEEPEAALGAMHRKFTGCSCYDAGEAWVCGVRAPGGSRAGRSSESNAPPGPESVPGVHLIGRDDHMPDGHPELLAGPFDDVLPQPSRMPVGVRGDDDPVG